MALFILPSLTKAQTPYEIPLQDAITLPDATFQQDTPARYNLPALPQKPGLIPVLRARIWVQSPTPGGFNWNAHLEFNRAPLLRRTAGGDERLLLRPTTFKLLQNGQYYSALQSENLAVMFAPSAAVADSMTDDKLGATFLFDLSDVARGVDNNVLEVFGHIPAKDPAPESPEKTVNLGHITDAAIGWIDKKYRQAPPLKLPSRSMLPPGARRGELSLAVGKRGGFALSFRGARLLAETDLGVGEARDELIADDTAPVGSTPGVQTAREKNGDWRITAKWPSGLQLERVLRLEADSRLSWRESWRNAGEKEVAVPFNHRLFLTQSEAPQIILGGNPDSGQFSSSPFNPTVFFSAKNASVGFGWVAEDDWLRALMHLANTGGVARVFSRSLALAPGKKIDFQMSLQAQASGSYWDFINALRRRWKVNDVRLERPLVWGAPPNTKLAGYDWILGPWQGLEPDARAAQTLDAQFKGEISEAALQKFFTYEHRRAAQTALQKRVSDIHQKSQQNRALVMMHPAMEVAYKPRLDLFSFTDETMLTRDGKPFEDGGYSHSWLGDATQHGWGVLYVSPRADNKYGQELLKRIRVALDEDHLDGMYSDEFTFAGLTRTYSRYDFRHGDGYTVLLDDDGKIMAHATDNTLATLSYQLAAIAEVKKRGKIFLVNTAPTTRAVQNAGIYHFVEAGNGFWFGANAHLTTPLQLGNVGTPATAAEVMKISRRLLNVGTLHVPLSGSLAQLSPGDNCIAKQFPITPVQLGAGFVVGRERIVSDISGDFAWPPKTSGALIYRYDENGNLLDNAPQRLLKSASRKNGLHLDAPAGGMAIAEFTG